MFSPNPHRPLHQTLALSAVVIGTAAFGAVVLWGGDELVVVLPQLEVLETGPLSFLQLRVGRTWERRVIRRLEPKAAGHYGPPCCDPVCWPLEVSNLRRGSLTRLFARLSIISAHVVA